MSLAKDADDRCHKLHDT